MSIDGVSDAILADSAVLVNLEVVGTSSDYSGSVHVIDIAFSAYHL